MDPTSGKVYDLSDPTIPPDVRERLIPMSEEEYTEALAKEKDDLMSALKDFDQMMAEQTYRPNRQERRAQARRDRKQKFVNKPVRDG